MSLLPQRPKSWTEAPIWQDVEFGSYATDLPLWEELGRNAGGAVLELGAGAGRVALDLARAGFEVVAIERDQELADELERRAEGLPVTVITGEIERLAVPLTEGAPTPRLAIAPLQLIQLLDEDERRLALALIADALGPGGRCALALVDESTLVELGVVATQPPDMREVEGWVYYSEPLWVQVSDRTLRMRRLRERVSPEGDLVRRVHDDVLHRLAPDRLEEEGRAAGMAPVERREIPSGPNEAGSIAVIMEVR